MGRAKYVHLSLVFFLISGFTLLLKILNSEIFTVVRSVLKVTSFQFEGFIMLALKNRLQTLI